MRHLPIVLATLVLCTALSSGRDRHGKKMYISWNENMPGISTEWATRHPPISRTTLPPIPNTTLCPERLIMNCTQPAGNAILNLTGTGLLRIGHSFVRSKDVREVYLDDNNIIDISPMAFNELPRLEVLSLSGNNISIARLLWFREHSALRRLVIDNNKFNVKAMTIKEILHPLVRLRELSLRRDTILGLTFDLKVFAPRLALLDLSGNNIISTDFLETAPTTLVDLRLDENQIRGIGQDILRNVEVLSVSGNKITEVCGTAACSNSSLSLAGMTKLRGLNASRNSITNVAIDTFVDTGNLISLDLSNNKIAALQSNAFNGLVAMEQLYMDHNQLNTIPNMCALIRLKYLDLSYNDIAEVTDRFCELTQLKTVLLANNHVLNVGQNVFAKLQRLRTLDLSNNIIDLLPMDLITDARSLEELSLRSNKIINIDELFKGRTNSLKELHLEDNPLPFIKVACLPHVTVHLNHMSVDLEEKDDDGDYD